MIKVAAIYPDEHAHVAVDLDHRLAVLVDVRALRRARWRLFLLVRSPEKLLGETLTSGMR